jgi:hypothetical protein
MKRQLLLLENSALNALFGQSASVDDGTLARVLARLKAAYEAYDIGLILTFPLLEEVAGIVRRDPARFRKVAEMLWDLGDGFLIRPSPERCQLEARRRRKLHRHEVFYPGSQVTHLRDAYLGDAALLVASDEHAYQVKRRYETDEKKRRELAQVELVARGQTWKTELGGDDRDWDAVVDEWTRFEMRRAPTSYGLPPDESDWPKPRDFVTLWHARAYTVARLVEVLGESRKIDGSDLYDAFHFDDAAYADVLITNDDAILRRASKYSLDTRVVSLEQWLPEVLKPRKIYAPSSRVARPAPFPYGNVALQLVAHRGLEDPPDPMGTAVLTNRTASCAHGEARPR